MNDFEDPRYADLYKRLETLVNDFTTIINEEEQAEAVPVAHVLVIGCDGYGPSDTGILLFPAHGFQAGWKTAGLIRMADSAITEDSDE